MHKEFEYIEIPSEYFGVITKAVKYVSASQLVKSLQETKDVVRNAFDANGLPLRVEGIDLDFDEEELREIHGITVSDFQGSDSGLMEYKELIVKLSAAVFSVDYLGLLFFGGRVDAAYDKNGESLYIEGRTIILDTDAMMEHGYFQLLRHYSHVDPFFAEKVNDLQSLIQQNFNGQVRQALDFFDKKRINR